MSLDMLQFLLLTQRIKNITFYRYIKPANRAGFIQKWRKNRSTRYSKLIKRSDDCGTTYGSDFSDSDNDFSPAINKQLLNV